MPPAASHCLLALRSWPPPSKALLALEVKAVLDKSWGGPTVTKDGVTVAEEIELTDKVENLGARMVREAASKTSKDAGDGTTTATVLAEALFKAGLRQLAGRC